ncbi:histidine phosphotransferase [Fertoebacter nigrum]|uniref:Histidine phosphotransferase n=1 Tax=Fertoeibacter niger TaxID=2656921 RepID=A0A8X8HA69_9RHOB|nr:histidine phosphotransferase family protein [Fertoeibacter niger]NUB46576.1 histidine phosphotransferase [Fertoeibacter niger]
MTNTPDLPALIGSRICHDLISPIGAIGNGVELMMMDGAMKGPEITLISESVLHANARIRFFRVAFGSATGEQRLGRPEVQAILSDLTRGTRLVIDWQGPADLPRPEVKLAFLAIQCLESALAYGGRITVERAEPRWVLTAHATRLKALPGLWAVLTDAAEAPDLTAAQVHFALLAAELGQQNRSMAAELRDTEVRLSF